MPINTHGKEQDKFHLNFLVKHSVSRTCRDNKRESMGISFLNRWNLSKASINMVRVYIIDRRPWGVIIGWSCNARLSVSAITIPGWCSCWPRNTMVPTLLCLVIFIGPGSDWCAVDWRLFNRLVPICALPPPPQSPSNTHKSHMHSACTHWPKWEPHAGYPNLSNHSDKYATDGWWFREQATIVFRSHRHSPLDPTNGHLCRTFVIAGVELIIGTTFPYFAGEKKYTLDP